MVFSEFLQKNKIETSFIINPLKYKIQTHSFTLDLDSLLTGRDLLFTHDFLFVLLLLDISLKKNKTLQLIYCILCTLF